MAEARTSMPGDPVRADLRGAGYAAAPHSARVVCQAIACSVCLYVLTRVPGPPIGKPVSVAQPRLA